MPEYHPGTDIEIPDAVPTSPFRNAIQNPKRYMKHNLQSLPVLCETCYTGDYDRLEELLSTGDEMNLFNGDINEHYESATAMMYAVMGGHTECVELLLEAKADPHVRENVEYGVDPEEGATALAMASQISGYEDIVEILEEAVQNTPYGYYIPEGAENNTKMYGGWEWGTEPPKGWYSSRPGVKERWGWGTAKVERRPRRGKKANFQGRKDGGVATKKENTEEPDQEETMEVARPPALEVLPPVSPIAVGLLFPGQGSQYVKMMAVVKDLPAVQEMLLKAKDILGYDVLDLCLKGPDTRLEETRYCQPAMFIAGLAGLEKLRNEREEAATRFQFAAGLSLGEYTALCAAGVFTFEDGLELVKLRGEAMQEAAGSSKQAMLSVAGVEKGKLAALCKDALKLGGAGAVCQIANELFPKGFSCAGTEKAILALKDMAEKAGALQAKVLKTSGGFHTPLMQPAAEKLGKALDAALPRMKPPRHTVYMNVTAKPVKVGTDPKVIVDNLKKQLTMPVLWEPTIRAMIKEGVTEFYEVGPMKQIKAMMKRIDQKVWGTTTNIEV